jgi:hypothetical protein
MRISVLPLTTLGMMAAALSACGSKENASADPNAPTVVASAEPAPFPVSLTVVGDGYPNSGDACRRIGESAATVDWLDDSADLVGCPTDADAKALGGRIVGNVEGISIVTVPVGGPGSTMKAPVAESTSPKTASGDLVRGKGGLEQKCLKKVAAEGLNVIGTNRIEESEAAIEIYVNVEGADAPWRCLGYRDGTVGPAEFTGSEGGA